MARKLVLCSDGTGNSGGKARGTNVWRFYQALIKDPARQIAFYQDGVGTQSFKFFRMLGGAFGWGLNTNLREMYRCLIHNYQQGDDIYLLGFSRGAFTVRALAYLLAHVGIIKPSEDPRETERRIDNVFSEYHWSRAEIRKFGKEPIPCLAAKTGTGVSLDDLVKSYQLLGKLSLEDALGDVIQRRQMEIQPPGRPYAEEEYKAPDRQFVKVKFVGVWDTVDAVGLPIDELTEALDWLFKFRFYNYDLQPIAEHNYHALSLDDERHTFHPVMWEECRDEEGTDRVAGRQVEQVWFPGVHSNVGGGYPKDEMACVALDWMMCKAETVGGGGLEFVPELRKEAATQADPAGKIYDSRVGVAAYYRYKPRKVREICEKAQAPVRMHKSVFDRIERLAESYAPVHVPGDYVIEPGGCHHNPIDPHRDPRLAVQAVADLVVWWRRVLYFLLLTTTGGLLLAIHRFAAMPLPQSEGWPGLIERIPAYFSGFLPGLLEKGLAAFNGRGASLIFFSLMFLALILLREYLRDRTEYLGKMGWNLAAGSAMPLPEKTPLEALAVLIKRCYAPQSVRDLVRERLFPATVFASVTLLLGFWLFNAFMLPANPPACTSPQVAAEKLDGIGGQRVLTGFHTCNPWYATGITLEKGETYSVKVRETSPWKDAQIAAGADGLKSPPNFAQKLMAFLRRDRDVSGGAKEGWFRLVADIGGKQQINVGSDGTITAEQRGPLHFYVNDAFCDLCLEGVFAYYRNNRGSAEITLTRTDGMETK